MANCVPRSNRGWRLGLHLFCLCALFTAVNAQAQLRGLVLDQNNQQSYLADVSPADASLTPIPGSLAAITLAPAAVANNPFTQQVFALGSASNGNLQLIRFNGDGSGAQIVGNSANPARALALHFERSSQRLIALLEQGGQLSLAELDATSAALTTIHSGQSDCCVLDSGVSALSNGQLFVSGRLRSDAAGTRRLLGFSTSGNNALSTTLLNAQLGVLVSNPSDGQLYGLVHSNSAVPVNPSLRLARILGDGSLVFVGTANPACCGLDFDVAAIGNNQLYAIAHPLAAAGGNALAGERQVLSVDLSSGAFNFSSAGLAPGLALNALFDVNKGLISTTTRVDSTLPDPVAIGQTYTIAASVSAASGSATGTVQISDDQGNSCSFAAPNGSCALAATQIGTRTLSANFAASGNYVDSSATTTIQVIQATSVTQIGSINPSPATVGSSYTVNVNVAGFNPTGTIAVDDGLGMTCLVTLPGTSCALSSTSAGIRTISAQYSGDSNNLSSNANTSHSVIPAASNISLGPVLPSPSTVGQSYTVSATVSGFGTPTGTVSINDGQGASCVITLPATSCNLSNNQAGALTLSAQYSGDGNNQSSSATLAHNVERAISTSQILSLVPNPVRAGSSYVVTVQVSGFGTPTGQVAVNDGLGSSCQITLPANSCMLTTLQAGTATVSANYNGDSNNLPSTVSASQTVMPSITAISMEVTPNPPVQGQAVTMEAILSDTVEPSQRGVGGTIRFSRNGQVIPGCEALTLNNSSALCSTQFEQASSILLRAEYSGDANNEPASVELGVIVEPLPIPTLSALGLLSLILLCAMLAWRQLARTASDTALRDKP